MSNKMRTYGLETNHLSIESNCADPEPIIRTFKSGEDWDLHRQSLEMYF